jgi:uncharacterized protein YjbI with pentapeptide repeats
MSEVIMKDCQHLLIASDANLEKSRFRDVRLAQLDCCSITFEQSKFSEGTFEQSNFYRIRLDGCVFHDVSFCDVEIKDSTYDGMTIDGIAVTELLDLYRATKGTL